jgi:iron complex outermembrane recepter protein
MTTNILRSTIAVLLSIWVLGSYAYADSVMLDEIAVRGKKESPSQESLTIREVRESPAKDIGEALQQVPGVSIVRKGAVANDVVLRGQQKDNINVFVDGVRIHNACPSRMDPPAFHIDFAQVEKIDILKGPYDLTNPGGIAGVVNAVSKKPGKGFGSDLNLTYGSYNAVNASATASYGTDRFNGLVGYAYKYSEPPKSGDGKRITEIYPSTSPNRYKTDAIDSRAYDINTGWATLGYNPTSASKTDLSYSYQEANHVLYPYLMMDAQYDRTNQINWNYQIERVSPLIREIKLQAYYDKVDHGMDDRYRQSSVGQAPGYSMQTNATAQVYGAKLSGAFAVGPGTLTAGADYYNRNWDAINRTAATGFRDVAMIPDVYTDNAGLFAGYEMPVVERVTAKGGVRGDFNWINANKPTNKPRDSTSFATIAGNVQLIWTPTENLETIAGFGSSVRPPDAQELYINSARQQGNPFLNSTRNNEFDLGVKYATNRFFAKAAVYYSSLQEFIYLVALGSTRTFKNIDATIWGTEFISQLALPYNLYLKGSLSYAEGRNKTDDRPLSEIPPLAGAVALRYDVEKWFVELAENFATTQYLVDSSLNEVPTDGWATTDLKAGFRYKGFDVYGGVYNLWDKFYYSYLSYLRDPFASGVKVPENGRNFYVTVAYKF